MWTALPKKVVLTAIVGFAIGAAIVVQWFLSLLGRANGPSDALNIVGPVVFVLETVFVIAFNGFWRPIWRRFPILGRLVFPDISGQWAGEIEWRDRDGLLQRKPITLTVVQLWTGFKVVLETADATSRSAFAWVEKDPDLGQGTLAYVYGHTPRETDRAANPSHEGTARLDFSLDTPSEASGSYYTQRRTSGDIRIRRI